MKSYNPFKMWGSYVGLVPGLISGFILGFLSITCTGEGCMVVMYLPIAVFMMVIGFLIGWGIHSLIRRLR